MINNLQLEAMRKRIERYLEFKKICTEEGTMTSIKEIQGLFEINEGLEINSYWK